MEKSRLFWDKSLFKGCPPFPKAWGCLREWYKTSFGQHLDTLEQQQLDEILPNLFGYHIAQVGLTGELDLLRSSRISHHFVCDFLTEEPLNQAGCKTLPDLLPLAPDSVDVLVLPHVLEFCKAPHDVLREVERVLIAEGHVVILGFNPFSLLSLWRVFYAGRRIVPWCGRFFAITRLKDWLSLLGFDFVVTNYYSYRPPIQHKGIMRRIQFVEVIASKLMRIFGGSYVIVARKRTVTLTPLRTQWHAKRVVAGLVEPMVPHDQNIESHNIRSQNKETK